MEWLLLTLILNTFLFIIVPPLWLYRVRWETVVIHAFVICLYWVVKFPTPSLMEWFRFNWLTQQLTYEYLNFQVDDPHHTLEMREKTIFLYHPHGVYAAGFFLFFALNKSVKHVTLGVSSILFRIPWIKDVMHLIGAVPVNKKDLVRALYPEGKSICICPGGLRELLVHKNAPTEYYTRKGILLLAQELKVNLVLVEAPDEASLYNVWIPSCLYPLQNFMLKRFLYPFPIFSFGNAWAPWWPKRPTSPFRLVFSAPVYADPNVAVENLMGKIYKNE